MLFRRKASQQNSGGAGASSFENSSLFEGDPSDIVAEYQTASCGGTRFALGVGYFYSGSKARSAEFSKHASKNDYEVRSIDIDGGSGGRLLAALPLKHSDCWLGAVLIAQVIGSGVFMQDIGGGRYWILAAAEGLPISRRDRIVDGEDHAHHVMMGFMSDLGQTSVFGDCGGSQRTAQECWSDVAEMLKSGHVPKIIRRFAAPRRKLTLLHLFVSVATVGAFAVVGYASWLMLSAPDDFGDKDRLAMLMQQMQTEQQRVEQQRRLRVAFESRVQEYANHAMRGSFAKQFSVIGVAVDRFPHLDVPAKFVALDCSATGRLPEQTWNCIPTVQMSRDMGLVPLLRSNPDDPLARDAVQQGALIGDALVITLAPFREKIVGFANFSQNPWPRLNPLEWKAYVADYVRHKGLTGEQIKSIGGAPDIVVAAHDFAENGVRLEGVVDKSVSHVLEMKLVVPLTPRSMAALYSAFAQRPAHIHAFRIYEGSLHIDLRLTLALVQ